MVKDIKKLFEAKRFNNSDEQKILNIITSYVEGLELKHIKFNRGKISFSSIPSALKMNILLQKGKILKKINQEGIFLRDII